MGCAAVRGAKKSPTTPDDEKTVSQPPVADTWATKLNIVTETEYQAASTTSPTNSGLNSPQKQNLVMQDADDDDEIEIIYETGPKKVIKQEPQMRSAANGQEGPEAAESSRQRAQQKIEAEKLPVQQVPLSVAQQQEAAKLAERRKKFDNDRFQRGQSAAEVGTPVQSAAVSTPVSQQQQSPNKFHTPMGGTPMGLMGLNQAARPMQGSSGYGDQNAFIPGGIFEESDLVQPVQQLGGAKKKIHTHDDVDSKGFDADDEKMMADILQDFDDV